MTDESQLLTRKIGIMHNRQTFSVRRSIYTCLYFLYNVYKHQIFLHKSIYVR